MNIEQKAKFWLPTLEQALEIVNKELDKKQTQERYDELNICRENYEAKIAKAKKVIKEENSNTDSDFIKSHFVIGGIK